MPDALPEGFAQPLCRPLTKRIKFFGLPMPVLMGALLGGYVAFGVRAYWALAALPPALVAARAAYASDDWGPACWLSHARMVAQDRTRLEA